MADVRALRGVRYDPGLADQLGRLIAPPYDSPITGRLGSPLSRAEFNIGKIENVQLAAPGDQHALAAARYRTWRESGILVRDPEPALYLHDHTFADGDDRRLRRGLLARVRLTDWAERVVLPHERTFPGPRRERLARLRAVGANLSPLYLLYHDPDGELRTLLEVWAAGIDPVSTDHDLTGADHRLTVLTDPAFHAAVARFFDGRRLFVADGHHRYEAALAYRDERRAAGAADPEAPSEFVLVLLADAADPGVRVLPTHRVVHGLPAFDRPRLRQELSQLFTLVPTGAEAAQEPALAELVFVDEPTSWWLRAKPDRPHEALTPAGRGTAWRSLDVAIVGSVLLDGLLGLGPERLPEHVIFTHDAAAARRLVAKGDGQLAVLLGPPSLPALMAAAEAGDPLPPKSSYFDPKAPAGLVINELNGVVSSQ